ncbi:MAG: CsgG/HfaB family protein, partial [Gemmatimonadaceae bacterium]
SESSLSPLGFALADLLTTDLARSARLQLVERARLGEVIRELDLAKSGRVDSATAPRVGLLLQAQQLLLGSLDTLPDGALRLSVRIADVETGVVQQAIDARAPLSDVLAAEKIVAFRLFDALGVILTPAERALVESRQTVSLEALEAFGRGLQADFLGQSRLATAEFKRALLADPGFRAAADRSAGVRAQTRDPGTSSVLLPGIRGIDAPISGVVDRLNRPLDVTMQSRPGGGPGDPAFPSTLVTVIVIVRRP